jgi:hypothetical protein
MSATPFPVSAAAGLRLVLQVNDPELIAELEKREPGSDREQYALVALRLGLLALRSAAGQMDAVAVRAEGERILSQLRETLAARNEEFASRVSAELTRYLDPQKGTLPERLRRLIQTDGELDLFLKSFLGPERSVMAETLRARLKEHEQSILREFTLDRPESALSRLNTLVRETFLDLRKQQTDFETRVEKALASLRTAREVGAVTTLGGLEFEWVLGQYLQTQAEAAADLFESTGATPGEIKNCKTGDFVIELGSDSAAPGARIVWEAKRDKKYQTRDALNELDEARRNRRAQVGVFVLSRIAAGESRAPLARHDNDILVVWDPQEAASDVYLQAAFSLARALCVRQRQEQAGAEQSVAEIETAINALHKQLEQLEQIRTWAETVKSHGDKISSSAGKVAQKLGEELDRLTAAAGMLRTPQP